MAPKRRAEEAETSERKRSRSALAALDSVADDWVCPITCELPVNPVTAEDGHVYERSAIARHIDTQGANLRSPLTNLSMGSALLPSPQARSTIEKLVRTGAISGDKADTWKQKIKDEEYVKMLQDRAEAGDASCMHSLAFFYSGKDPAQSYAWYKRGADANHASCLAAAGRGLLFGIGVAKNEIAAMCLLVRAAEAGSDNSSRDLGDYYFEGTHGLPQDRPQARYWYNKFIEQVSGSSEFVQRVQAGARRRAEQRLAEC